MYIGITITKAAYTPEAYAYEKYLAELGHYVQLDYTLDPNNDINIYFMGFKPFWKKRKGNAIEIHEYQSLSTPPYSYHKNLAKRFLNRRPSGRIFLNETVHSEMAFKDNISYIYRDMGVDSHMFQTPSENPIYDIVYCGSIKGRLGLIEHILKLSKFFKIVVVGNASESEREILNHKNITLVGAIERDNIPDIYREARYGLNFTPDIYPYNIQTSTKTLEYLASGLDVISNKYEWSENFFSQISYQPYWLDEALLSTKKSNLRRLTTAHKSIIKEYSWDNILRNANLDAFLRDRLNHDIY